MIKCFFYPLEDIVTLNLYASNNIAFKIYITKDDRTKRVDKFTITVADFNISLSLTDRTEQW